MESLEKPWHRALCLCSLCTASYIQKTLSIPASFEMDGGGSSLGGSHQGEEEQKNKKESMLTDKEQEEKRLENVIPTSWDDTWIVTLNITKNVLKGEVVENVSGFDTDSPKRKRPGDRSDDDETDSDDDSDDDEAKKKASKE